LCSTRFQEKSPTLTGGAGINMTVVGHGTQPPSYRSFLMPRAKTDGLTTPDLVLLSLLAERPMHGYEANAELERRQIRDWAGVSRPQVYYSLDKLARLGLIRDARDDTSASGPERRVFTTSAKGRTALAAALARGDWALQRDRPPFLTWLALSWQAEPGVFLEQIARRREFLNDELAREEATLRGIKAEVGHRYHEAVWMVGLVIDQFRTELKWLQKLSREAGRRASAQHPPHRG
jgi:DNA-binding PadR family transcriptional regulator